VRVLVVSGIWPPDIGGPASHAPEVAEYLRGLGHSVEVVTTASAAPPPRPYPVRWTPRHLPVGLRHVHGVQLIARRAREAGVVYSTGLFGRTMVACALARRPYVLKLTGDPAFERARWRGSVSEDVDAFQRGSAAPWLRRLRDLTVRRAAHVFCPSAYLRELAVSWGADASHTEVLPNPAPVPPRESREELRRRHGFEGPTLVFAGRLTAQKALDVAFDAVARVAGVTLAVVGDGPERERLERSAGDRVRFLGAVPRGTALELFRAADAALLSSGWENFPHAVVEALAVGTPVIATDVGGVAEVVRDGENGLLVAAGDSEALADAIARFVSDAPLRERLRTAAAASAEPYAADRLFARLEAVLEAVARR
jgi:glycosyltransferase involved in cell wall biosynthesis